MRYFTVLTENRKPGNETSEPWLLWRVRNIIIPPLFKSALPVEYFEPNLGVDLRRGAYAIPQKTALRYRLGLWQKTKHDIYRDNYRSTPKR